MGRRRPTRPVGRPQATTVAPLWWHDQAERLARGYLASLVAVVIVAFVLVLTSAVAPAICAGRADAGECGLGLGLAVGLFGFALAVVPAALIVRLGWWYACAVIAGYGVLVVNPSIEQWWWWAAWALLPVPAALLSSDDWAGWRLRRIVLGLAAAAGLGAMAWWLAAGR